jgi:hypothetical protein
LTTPDSPDHSVKRFAEIMASLANPFAEPAAVLSAAGYDAASWSLLEREWSQRIARDTSGRLASAFGQAFAAPSGAPVAPGDLDRTVEVPVPELAPVLPFSTAPREDESGLRRVPAVRRIYEPPIRPRLDPNESTLEMPILDTTSPDLPFQPPRRVSRLHQFDSQTGALLPEPVWIDDPISANDPNKPA